MQTYQDLENESTEFRKLEELKFVQDNLALAAKEHANRKEYEMIKQLYNELHSRYLKIPVYAVKSPEWWNQQGWENINGTLYNKNYTIELHPTYIKIYTADPVKELIFKGNFDTEQEWMTLEKCLEIKL